MKPSYIVSVHNEKNLKGTVYRADKFLQVNMTHLTVLIIIHEYIVSRFFTIPPSEL